MNPRITVLIATYNQAAFLPQALESLRAQKLPEGSLEAIVVNDGSTDGTSAILRSAPWIRLVERENRGLVRSCNEGLALARGAYFARLDSDDFVDARWLAVLSELLDASPEACCAYPDRYELRGSARARVDARPGDLYSLEACGTLFRAEALRRAGGFRPFYWEEYDLYLRLRPLGAFLHAPEPLYTYRKHAAAMTQDPARRLAGWRELLGQWGPEALRAAGRNAELEKAIESTREEG